MRRDRCVPLSDAAAHAAIGSIGQSRGRPGPNSCRRALRAHPAKTDPTPVAPPAAVAPSMKGKESPRPVPHDPWLPPCRVWSNLNARPNVRCIGTLGKRPHDGPTILSDFIQNGSPSHLYSLIYGIAHPEWAWLCHAAPT